MRKETPRGDAGGFAALGLDPRLVEGLEALGYEEPTAIQQETIPRLLEGRDLVGQAATGTGKTAAFALPLLQRFAERPGKRRGVPFALVLVAFISVAATLESVLAFCLGCQIFALLMRVNVIPPEVCEACNDIRLRHPVPA